MTEVKRPERLPSEILSDGLWMQRAMASDARGEDVHPDSADAVAWCMVGACEAAHHGETPKDFYCAVEEAALTWDELILGLNMFNSVADALKHWNDYPSRTKDEVIEALREAEERYYGSSS